MKNDFIVMILGKGCKKIWNYVKDGKLPRKRDLNVSDHCIVAVKGYTYPTSGYYDFDMKAWFVDGSTSPVDVYAWRNMKMPKEK